MHLGLAFNVTKIQIMIFVNDTGPYRLLGFITELNYQLISGFCKVYEWL